MLEPFLKAGRQALMDFLFPPVCLFCGTAYPRPEHPLHACFECRRLLSPYPIKEAFGLLPDTTTSPLRPVLTLFPYQAPMTQALRQYKFHGAWEKSRGLSDLYVACWKRLWETLKQEGIPYTNYGGEVFFIQGEAPTRAWTPLWPRGPEGPRLPDLVLPLPLHASRLRKRGYNQVEAPTHALADCLGLPPPAPLLIRQRATLPQTEREGPEARRSNVEGAFGCPNPAAIRGRFILLVDDVVTTGWSLAEAVRVLEEAGALAVFSIALAGRHARLRHRAIIGAPEGRNQRFEPS